jgi:hypothetical protein
MNYKRHLQNQDTIAREKRKLYAAQRVVERFRRDGDVSEFPELRYYLSSKNRGFRSFDLSGWGPDPVRLTAEEYDRMKAAYKATPEGATETEAKAKAYEPY